MIEFYQQLNISHETAYNRMERLQIKPWKKGRHSFLDREQVGYMNDLHRYYQKTRKFDGFPIPKPTGPWEETELLEEKPGLEASGLAIREEVTIEQVPHPSTTTSLTPVEVEGFQAVVEKVAQQKQLATLVDELKEIHEKSQYRAASRTVIHETLTLLYESTEQYTIDGLKEKVEAHKQRCRAARRGGHAGVQNFLNQSLRSPLPSGKNGSTQ